MAFKPSTFDTAFARVVKYLVKEEIVLLKDISDKLTIVRQNVTDILALRRGVPEHKIPTVIYVLTKDYNVRPEFLSTGTGDMFTKPIKPNSPEAIQLLKKINSLEEENKALKNQIENLKEWNQTQSQLIALLQKEIKKHES
ncbi:MAG: hypothetical protein ACTHMC_01655 [Pseudobacter sp.]|uniref:hypothetical protein n=1 Tax=Pseudobacter sp. TaxID=2045420 RepID=UPI003F7F3DE7